LHPLTVALPPVVESAEILGVDGPVTAVLRTLIPSGFITLNGCTGIAFPLPAGVVRSTPPPRDSNVETTFD